MKCHIFLIKGRLTQINKRSFLIYSVIFLGKENGQNSSILNVLDTLSCGKSLIKLDMIRIIRRKWVKKVGEWLGHSRDYQKGSIGKKLLIIFFSGLNFERKLLSNFINCVDKRIRSMTVILKTQVQTEQLMERRMRIPNGKNQMTPRIREIKRLVFKILECMIMN